MSLVGADFHNFIPHVVQPSPQLLPSQEPTELEMLVELKEDETTKTKELPTTQTESPLMTTTTTSRNLLKSQKQLNHDEHGKRVGKGRVPRLPGKEKENIEMEGMDGHNEKKNCKNTCLNYCFQRMKGIGRPGRRIG